MVLIRPKLQGTPCRKDAEHVDQIVEDLHRLQFGHDAAIDITVSLTLVLKHV